MNKILYKKTRLGKIQQWSISVKEKGDSGHPEVWIEHGLSDGKKQTTFDIIDQGVNLGKANETTSLEQAKLVSQRKVIKQLEEGYRKSIEEIDCTLDIDFDERLVKELCFYKPKNSIDQSKIDKLAKSSRLMLSIKEDGLMYVVRKTSKFGVEIYSRRMELETEKFPHLKEQFEKLENDCILLGEIVVPGCKSHIEAFKKAGKICRSDPEKALKRQKEFGLVSYKIFDLAFYNRKNLLTSMKYKDRYNQANIIAKKLNSKNISTVEIINKSHTKALEYVIENNIEGIVIWDSDGIMKDGGAYTFNGKAYRPNVLWKSKPKHEDDFIVRWNPDKKIGDYGSGKNKGKIKNVFIYQLDENRQEVFLGKCGGGLKDKERDFYTDINLFPRVWKIEYDAIQLETGALRYPVFSLDRTSIGDKQMKECLLSEDINEAREVNKK